MTRRSLTLAALSLSLAGAVGVPALTVAQSPGPRELTLRVKVIAGGEARRGSKGAKLAPGDAIIVKLAVTGVDGAKLGTVYAECTNAGGKAAAEKAYLKCVQTYHFNNGSELVGGSGDYKGATGHTIQGTPVQGFDSVDVLQLNSAARSRRSGRPA